jgi:tetratricopeptide (TPR) repeat protein
MSEPATDFRTLLLRAHAALNAQRLKEASDLYAQVLAVHPNADEALYGMSQIALRLGEGQKAIAILRQVLTLQPEVAVYQHAMGRIHTQAGLHHDALPYYAKAAELAETSAPAQLAYGVALFRAGKLKQSEAPIERAAALDPQDPEARMVLGQTYLGAQRLQDARVQFDAALTLHPQDKPLLLRIAKACQNVAYYEGAEHYYLRILELDALHATAHHGVALARLEQGAIADSLPHAEKAVELEPAQATYQHTLGVIIGKLGQLERAVRVLREAIRLAPDTLEPYKSLVFLSRAKPDDTEIRDRLEHFLTLPELKPEVESELHFMLGKIYDDCGDVAKAFPHFQRGNQMRHSYTPYDPFAEKELFEALETLCSEAFFDQHCGMVGSDSRRPIFIVGMPRSGSTLLEQILSHHPLISGGDELVHLPHLVGVMNQVVGAADLYPHCLAGLTETHARNLAGYYLEKTAHLSPEKPHFTDKMLANFLHIGLIHCLFPQATILHSMRHPLDCGLSIYMQDFINGNDYAYDLNQIGRYMARYQRLMAHWHHVLPGRVLDVSYEGLVADMPGTVARVLEHVGVPWSDTCLHYTDNRRSVQTASAWQVRQPLYQRSIGRWKPYAEYLGPLRAHFPDI